MKVNPLFKKLTACLILIFTVLSTSSSYAIPLEIILIRHADKLDQYQPGPFLSAIGQARAEMFMRYYINKMEPTPTPAHPYPEQTFPIPNFIIATMASHASNREQLTIAPLASELISQGYLNQYNLILNTFSHGDEGLKKLSKSLLTDAMYNNQFILICWHHGEIPKLLDLLGVKPHQDKLPDDEYDTVYDIKFMPNGSTMLFILRNQYPVSENTSSDSLRMMK